MKHFLTIVIAIVASVATTKYFSTSPSGYTEKESTYERVMRTGTIRCGYALWGNYLQKDPNTGEFSGIIYDYVTTLAHNLSLKIEWTEEVGWGEAVAGLTHNRFDAWCAGMGWNAERARKIDYTIPFMALKSGFYVRSDDNRFDSNIQRANQEDVTISLIEGEFYGKVLQRDFNKATHLALPQLSQISDVYENVSSGKADLTFNDTGSAYEYMRNNPGKLKEVKLDRPYLSVPLSITMKHDNHVFRRMLDVATQEMIDTGVVNAILRKYEIPENTLIRTHSVTYRERD